MSYLHRCSFCGWERTAAAPTIVNPACEHCGSMLECVEESELPSRPAALQGLSSLRVTRRVSVTLRLVVAFMIVAAAAVAGFRLGGVFAACVAFGVVGLAVVELLVPEEI